MKERERLLEVVNVKEEKDKNIVALAENEGVALIAFIAPYVPVRVSPIEEVRAHIGLPDEFGIEALIEILREKDIRKAYLLVNSPGGAMASSYKIAKAIRTCLDEITTFVPHIAASGGTLLALTGNQIVMGSMSQLTPLDVQIPYGNTVVSVTTCFRFLERASKWFERKRPEEAPYPQRALADKLDPLLMEEWWGLIDTAISYVTEILASAGYDNGTEIAHKLILGFPSHGFVITKDKAEEVGLHIESAESYRDAWAVMRYWLSRYIFKEEATHCIRFVLPEFKKKRRADEKDKSK